MPVPSNNTGAITSVNGTLTSCTLTLDNNSTMARFTLSGTYTGVTGTIDVSNDGSTWFNISSVDEGAATGSVAVGTLTASAANKTYLVQCDGWNYVRYIPTAVASGTLSVVGYGANSLGGQFPIIQLSSSTTSGTNLSLSGTLAVTGATTLSSTLAVTSTSTLTGAVTTGASVVPAVNDVGALGDATHGFADLFLASGALINVANGNAVITHSSGIFTVSTGDLRVTTAGTNAASVVTVGGTQTLAAKTLTTPVIGVATGTSLAVTGLLTTSSPTAAFGYVTGAGGAVTQASSITTGVTLNTNTGTITTVASTLAAGVDASFTVTNSAVAATDVVVINTKSYAGTADGIPICKIQSVAAGSFVVNVHNQGAVALDAAIVMSFAVIKGVAA